MGQLQIKPTNGFERSSIIVGSENFVELGAVKPAIMKNVRLDVVYCSEGTTMITASTNHVATPCFDY